MVAPFVSIAKHAFKVGRVAEVLFLIIALGAVTGFYLWQRNTHHVAVGPGEMVECKIEVAMQRLGEHKFYAKDVQLPVACTLVPATEPDDGVVALVTETGHGVHLMWANLQIAAAPNATPGTRKRRFEFTIDGHDDWPRATVVVQVTNP